MEKYLAWLTETTTVIKVSAEERNDTESEMSAKMSTKLNMRVWKRLSCDFLICLDVKVSPFLKVSSLETTVLSTVDKPSIRISLTKIQGPGVMMNEMAAVNDVESISSTGLTEAFKKPVLASVSISFRASLLTKG